MSNDPCTIELRLMYFIHYLHIIYYIKLQLHYTSIGSSYCQITVNFPLFTVFIVNFDSTDVKMAVVSSTNHKYLLFVNNRTMSPSWFCHRWHHCPLVGCKCESFNCL